MLKRFGLLVLIACLSAGCGATADDEADASKSVSNARSPQPALTWNSRECTLPDSPTAPIGQTAETLRRAFGKPVDDTRFLFANGLYAPREVLLNRLPLKGNERTPIREMVWVKGGCSLIVWLTQNQGVWRAVQTARSSASAEY